jgi:acetyl esterase/lipase
VNSRFVIRWAVLVTAIVSSGILLAACESTPSGPDDVVEGVDLAVLFAPPTAAEIQSIRDEWAGRNPIASDVEVAYTRPFPLGATPATLRVLSHAIDGNRHFGAVIAPDDGAPRPVLVLLHGGDSGVNVTSDDVLAVLLAFGELADDFVYAVPSFRSEILSADGQDFLSTGEASPWDRDVDDAIAFLSVTLETTPVADPDRVAVVGFSRGGLVGLLMAIRDPRVERLLEFFGPTDFFDDYVRDLVVDALEGRPRDVPGQAVLDARFIQPLKAGALSEADVRPELVRRSAVLFAADLPTLQVHHGTADDVVDVSQARSLIRAMERLGRGPPQFEAFLYEGGEHDPLTLPGSIERARAFVTELASALVPGAD